jgi:hypothetical protein
MGFTDKTNDNIKARRDLPQIYNRPTLELIASGDKPHAPFGLKPKERNQAMIWLQNFKFPDGYATGFRRAVNLDNWKLSGVKSHYDIFIQRLLPVMFHGYLNDCVWKAL